MTQKQRVLRALELADGRGVKTIDFDAGNVIDGRSPIRRVAARIGELRNEGYRIRSFTKNGICTYVLLPHLEAFEGPALTTPDEAPATVVGAAGVAGPEWSTEGLAVTAPVSGRAPESSPEDYIEEEELLWV